MFGEEFPQLAPVTFFGLSVDCHQQKKPGLEALGRKYLLPDTSELCGEDSFADVALAWSQEGLSAHVKIQQSFQECYFPLVEEGDSVEFFIDTRDIKTSGYNTRFCHHFFFLPKEDEGHIAGEKTHFRTDNRHDLCNPALLQVKAAFKKNSYTLQIYIPSECLHGYDPAQFDRLGFSYRINRYRGDSQHFSVLSEEYQMEQQPSLWSSVSLIT